jgi:hypothetical protein
MARRRIVPVLSVLAIAGFLVGPVGARSPSARASTPQPIPLYDQWTAEQQVFDEGNGEFSATIGAGPIQAPDPESPTGWSPIDTSLEATQTGFAPRSSVSDILFSSGDPASAATVAMASTATTSISLGLDADSIPAPVVSGDTATYVGVQPGVDATLRATATGFEESYTVASAESAPAQLDIPLGLQGLTPSLTAGGALTLTDADGNVVGQVDTPLMWGAATDAETGEPLVVAPVPTRLLDAGEGYVLELTPDPSFWSNPALTFPVTIDPSSSLSVTTDTYVRSDLGTSSFGSATDVRIGHSSSATVRALIQFGSSAVTYHTIDSATLNLYESFSSTCTAKEIDVYEAAGEWSGTTPWNDAPDVGAMYASTSDAHGGTGCAAAWSALSTGGDGTLTMTDLVQSWANANNNLGVIVTTDESGNYSKWFNSSEASSNVPTLSVTYHAGDPDALLADPNLSETQAEDIAAIGGFDPDAYSDCPPPDPMHYPVTETVTYKGSLEADLYMPNIEGTTQYPAMVLVHGGGFWRGCKTEVQKAAAVLAGTYGIPVMPPQQFMVLSINYRLACNGADDYLDFATETNDQNNNKSVLCGYKFHTSDSTGYDNYDNGPAVHDVEDAVQYVRDNASTWCDSCWNGYIELVGASSGGNLAFEASGRVGPGPADGQADAVGSWSAPLFMEQLDNSTEWPCDRDQSHKSDKCQSSEENYISCQIGTYPPTGPTCPARYGQASPRQNFEVNSLPRAFIANGYPYCPHHLSTCQPQQNPSLFEVISLESAKDFTDNLDANDWTAYPLTGGVTGSYDFCQVDIDEHVLYIFEQPCENDPTNTALYSMVDYLSVAVNPP